MKAHDIDWFLPNVLVSFLIFCSCGSETTTLGRQDPERNFRKVHLTDQYYAEGANMGDLNRDGHPDVVAGPYWYQGPNYEKKHEYYSAEAFDPLGYADNFFVWVEDVNRDQWNDIVTQGFPGKEAFWYENPKGENGLWKRHLAYPSVDNESPAFGDLNGDGRKELIFHHEGILGYAGPDPERPETVWKFQELSEKQHWGRFTHGLGYGDLTRDGLNDIVMRDGLWQNLGSAFKVQLRHQPFLFTREGEPGGAQMLVYDVDGDQLNDVITAWNAHGYGLAWYEQQDGSAEPRFREHVIMNRDPEESPFDLSFSQLHALALADIDSDGLQDFVTGKCFWAHGPTKDPEPNAPAVIYWFQLRRERGGITFVPHLVDDDSGVGRQVSVGDLNGDGHPDIVTANKKGTFVFIQEVQPSPMSFRNQ